ncbi:hypothetical protein L1987_31595 [Smallanthus sonchifolius]|uniref:Uncharacterized protein n=1 Tax=Smallanthus sonchifolius TaxID=185202 RepID=A0ACB9I606_9ASTR|nr:hypothetical protein L1987_31595 [Smallanthus sonchifolius]
MMKVTLIFLESNYQEEDDQLKKLMMKPGDMSPDILANERDDDLRSIFTYVHHEVPRLRPRERTTLQFVSHSVDPNPYFQLMIPQAGSTISQLVTYRRSGMANHAGRANISGIFDT